MENPKNIPISLYFTLLELLRSKVIITMSNYLYYKLLYE